MEQSQASRVRRLHPFANDPSVARVTYRLYRNRRCVGLAKRIGGGYFFSRDGGFAWTGTEIQADTWAMASCLRDHKNRVLHSGDLVIQKGNTKIHRGIVVVDDHRDTWLYQPRSRQLENIDARACRPRWSKLTLVESTTGISSGMRAQIDHALATLHLARALRWKDVALFVLTIFGSGVGTALGCWWIRGQVGFVVPLIATMLASWGLHRLQIQSHGAWLSRRSMLALTHRVALIAGTLGSLFLLGFGLIDTQTAEAPGVVVFALVWLTCVFACGVICLLSGDLATWQSGGYPGEGAS